MGLSAFAYQQLLHNKKMAKEKTLARNRTNQPRSKIEPTRTPQPATFDAFVALLEASGLPLPRKEWPFHATRRWRFDYAWPLPHMVAIEVEGGIFAKGGSRHNRGAGMRADMEKYNQAVLLGWRVLKFLPEQMAAGDCLPLLRILLKET